MNSLKIAEENITQAESTLRDSDMAAEMSNLTKDQINAAGQYCNDSSG